MKKITFEIGEYVVLNKEFKRQAHLRKRKDRDACFKILKVTERNYTESPLLHLDVPRGHHLYYGIDAGWVDKTIKGLFEEDI